MRETELRDVLKNNLGGQLAKARTYWGISKIDLARAIGVSQPYITNIESGYQLPSLTVILSLCATFKVPVDFFLSNGEIGDYLLERAQFENVASTNRDIIKQAVEMWNDTVYFKSINKFNELISECQKAGQLDINKGMLNKAIAQAEVALELLKAMPEHKDTVYADTFASALGMLQKEVAYEVRKRTTAKDTEALKIAQEEDTFL